MGADKTTKTQLQKKFTEMYSRMPLSKIRVSDLIKECAIARGTFYFYYQDIRELYLDCEKEIFVYLDRAGLFEIKLSTLRGDYDKHIQVLADFLKRLAAIRDEMRVFLTGSEKEHFRDAFRHDVKNTYTQLLTFSQDLSEEELFFRSTLIGGAGEAVMEEWILTGCEAPAELVAAELAKFVFYGMFSTR